MTALLLLFVLTSCNQATSEETKKEKEEPAQTEQASEGTTESEEGEAAGEEPFYSLHISDTQKQIGDQPIVDKDTVNVGGLGIPIVTRNEDTFFTFFEAQNDDYVEDSAYKFFISANGEGSSNNVLKEFDVRKDAGDDIAGSEGLDINAFDQFVTYQNRDPENSIDGLQTRVLKFGNDSNLEEAKTYNQSFSRVTYTTKGPALWSLDSESEHIQLVLLSSWEEVEIPLNGFYDYLFSSDPSVDSDVPFFDFDTNQMFVGHDETMTAWEDPLFDKDFFVVYDIDAQEPIWNEAGEVKTFPGLYHFRKDEQGNYVTITQDTNKDYVGVRVFDPELNMIYESEMKFEVPDSSRQFLDISPDGSVISIMSDYEFKAKRSTHLIEFTLYEAKGTTKPAEKNDDESKESDKETVEKETEEAEPEPESEEVGAEPEETEQEPEAAEEEVEAEPEAKPVTGFNPLLGEWFSEGDFSAATFNEDGTLTYHSSGDEGSGTYTYTDNYNISFSINGNELAGKLEYGILYMGEPQTDNVIEYNKIITPDSPPLSQVSLEQSKILGDWNEFYGFTFGYSFSEDGKVHAGWDTVHEGSYKISGQKLLLTFPDGTLTGELVGDTLVFTNDHDSRPLIMTRQ